MRQTILILLLFTSSPLFAEGALDALKGNYQIIDIRANSGVAAPLSEFPSVDALGERVEITDVGINLKGLDCDDWELAPADGVDLFVNDPTLADLQISPNDEPVTAGDARLNALFRLSCEGDYATTIFQADAQVLVATTENESRYVVLERILTTEQISFLQEHLRNTKFLEVDTKAGVLDTSTLEGLRGWYRYRQKDSGLPVPLRVAITRNLLDGTGVWHPN